MATTQTVVKHNPMQSMPHRRIIVGESIRPVLLQVGRNNNRRSRSDCVRQKQEPVVNKSPYEVVKAKSVVKASKQRSVFLRSRITDPAVLARDSTSFVSVETSVTFVLDDADAEASWNSVNDDDDYVDSVSVLVEAERKVRFRVDDDDKIVADYVPAQKSGNSWFQQHKSTEGTTTSNTTMTGNEFRTIISDIKTYIVLIKAECPEIVDILTRMFQDTTLVAGALSAQDASLLHKWSASHGRGLEDHLITDVKKHRTNARSRILKFQEKMSSIGCRDYTQALRERSCMESQQSVAFARIMAIGDALEAESIHFRKSSSRKSIKM